MKKYKQILCYVPDVVNSNNFIVTTKAIKNIQLKNTLIKYNFSDSPKDILGVADVYEELGLLYCDIATDREVDNLYPTPAFDVIEYNIVANKDEPVLTTITKCKLLEFALSDNNCLSSIKQLGETNERTSG